MLYRCLKPLWYTRVQELKEHGNNLDALQSFLDMTESDLTSHVDFRKHME